MSTNEETREPSTEAAEPTGAPPTAAPQTTPTPSSQPRSQSRFYSRMGRSSQAGAAAKPTASAIPAEGLTAEEAINLNLKDNLPVRATMGDLAEFAPVEGREGGPREGRRDRGDHFERGDRGGRGDRGDRRERRGRGEGRERGPRRDREREGDFRSGNAPETSQPAEETAPVEAPSPIIESQIPPTAAPAQEERPRRLRFEDAAPEAHSRTVEEFRPSRDRSRGERSRPQPERDEPAASAAKGRSPGLLGWMKSIFSAPEEGTEATAEKAAEQPPRERGDRGPREKRGPRPGGGQGQHQPRGDAAGDGPDGKRRRRRRRGGRNRRRDGEGRGPAGGDQG